VIRKLVKELAAGAVIAVSKLKILLAIYGFIIVGDKHLFSELVISVGKRTLCAVRAAHAKLKSLTKLRKDINILKKFFEFYLSLFLSLEIFVASF